MNKLTQSQWVALIAAAGASILGAAGMLDSINPKLAIIFTILGTIITLFCKNIASAFKTDAPGEDDPQ